MDEREAVGALERSIEKWKILVDHAKKDRDELEDFILTNSPNLEEECPKCDQRETCNIGRSITGKEVQRG